MKRGDIVHLTKPVAKVRLLHRRKTRRGHGWDARGWERWSVQVLSDGPFKGHVWIRWIHKSQKRHGK